MTGPVAWWPVALALALRRFDQGWTARILEQSDDQYCCDDQEFGLLAATLGRGRPDPVLRLVASVDGAGGPRRLIRGLENLNRIRPVQPLPRDIETLEQIVAATLPEPPPDRLPPTRPARRATPGRRRRRTIQNQPALNQNPPAVNREQPPREDLFTHPQQWRHLHRARAGDIDLILPEGPAQLRRWGGALRNCLGAYDTAIADRSRLVLGIRHREVLRGAVAINPTTHRIVTIEAAAQRPLSPAIVEVVTRLLANHGAIRPA
jgi:hypothetical protein